jgi:hypothetical protein
VSVVHFVIGLAALAVGLVCVARRQAIVARHERTSQGRPVQAPAAYLVLGVLLVLVGVSQLVTAFV